MFQGVSGGMYGSTRAEAEEREEEVIFVGIIDTLVPFKVFWVSVSGLGVRVWGVQGLGFGFRG